MKEFTKGAPKAEKTPEQVEAERQAAEQRSMAKAASGPLKPATGAVVPLAYDTLDFSNATLKPYQEPFAIAAYGAAGSGKTRLLATAPGTVGVVPVNRKTRQTVEQTARQLGKKIKFPAYDLIRSSNPMKAAMLPPFCEQAVEIDIRRDQPWCCAKHNSRWTTDRIKQCTLDLYADPGVNSVGLDGFDILCEDMLAAHFGRAERIMARDRGPFNKEMIEFLGALSGKHLVLTMGQKEVWRNDKPTGKFDWAGWSHLNYHTNCIVEMRAREDYDPSRHDFQFSLTVVMCQANAALMGKNGDEMLVDGMISFPGLAVKVYPETEWEDWE